MIGPTPGQNWEGVDMVIIVTVLGLVSCVVAIILLLKPAAYHVFAERALESQLWYAGAIALRIGVGVIFMLVAQETRYPGGIFWIGVAFTVAAIVILFYPKQRMRGLVEFWESRPAAVRAVSVLVFMFGAYLVHATT